MNCTAEEIARDIAKDVRVEGRDRGMGNLDTASPTSVIRLLIDVFAVALVREREEWERGK